MPINISKDLEEAEFPAEVVFLKLLHKNCGGTLNSTGQKIKALNGFHNNHICSKCNESVTLFNQTYPKISYKEIKQEQKIIKSTEPIEKKKTKKKQTKKAG